MKNIKVSVVIPVFNSSKSLENLINELSIQLKDNYSSYEVILIDDKSNDNSWEVVANLCKLQPIQFHLQCLQVLAWGL